MKLRIVTLTAILALAGLCACKSSKPADGPAESAGESIDNAAKKTKDTVKKGANEAADAVEDTTDEAKKKSK